MAARNPAKVCYREGGGPESLWALAVVAIGLALLTGGVQANRKPGPFDPLLHLAIVAFGAYHLLSRRGIDFDLRARTYRVWWGLGMPIHAWRGSFDSLERVALEQESRGKRVGRDYRVYTVKAVGPATAS